MNAKQIKKREALNQRRLEWMREEEAEHDRNARTLRQAWVAYAVVIVMALALAVLPAFAHSWYSQACCSGKDCAPIPESAVTWTPGGWRVALNPGQHPMVTIGPMVELVPFSEVMPSMDSDFHACIRTANPSPSAVTPAERVICLYVPEGQFGA